MEVNEFRRIEGDDRVAVELRAVEDLIKQARAELQAGDDLADRCSLAVETITRAEMVFTTALGHLEQISGVPFTALMIDPAFQTCASKPRALDS